MMYVPWVVLTMSVLLNTVWCIPPCTQNPDTLQGYCVLFLAYITPLATICRMLIILGLEGWDGIHVGEGRGHLHNPDIPLSEYTIDAKCTNGSLHWNYPTGSIRLHFKSMADDLEFTTCLVEHAGANSMVFTDETAGRNTSLPRLKVGAEVCLNSTDREVTVLMYAPDVFFVAVFKYYTYAGETVKDRGRTTASDVPGAPDITNEYTALSFTAVLYLLLHFILTFY